MSGRRTSASLGRRLDLLQRRMRFAVQDSPINVRRMTSLDPDLFRGRRVAVIGPARSVFTDIGDIDINGFDVIVRMNNAIPLAMQHPATLGTRTDVLFHNMNETGPRNAGAIPMDMLRAHRVRYCVFPHWTYRGSKKALYAKQAELAGQSDIALTVLPQRFCEELRRRLDDHKPTTGASAILFFLQCPLRELHLYGFSFFRTRYADGYNDAVASDAAAADWIAASEIHDPDRERLLIHDAIDDARNRGMAVVLGRDVQAHLG